MGRPSTFTTEVAEAICRRLAEGQSLREICRDEGMPPESTVRGWYADDEQFAAQYARARDLGLDALADEMLDIAHDGTNDWTTRLTKKGEVEIVLDREHVERSKLRVDTLKWRLAKLAPKRYGDRVAMEHSGKDGAPLIPVINVRIGGDQSTPPSEAG